MKRFISSVFVLILSFGLAACENMSNQDVGTVAGAVAGGILGSSIGGGSGRTVAIATGTLVGAYLGGSVGRNMDRADRARMVNALENNRVGQPAYWKNRRTHATYEVTPVKNVKRRGNRYCREYRTTADIAGKKQQIYGTACRQPDGSWKVVK